MIEYSNLIILDELREILKLVKEINDRIAELADKIYEDENERG